jgi:bifunctional DNA-binding transcriptional regulator/antitoxin component of YhaV-PrlF toxin-antitoxin module
MGDDGKLDVPEGVRAAFALKPGDIVDFYLDEKARTARVRARNISISTMLEMFSFPQAAGQPMSIEEMDSAIGEYLTQDDERIRRDAREWEEFQRWRRTRSDRAAE